VAFLGAFAPSRLSADRGLSDNENARHKFHNCRFNEILHARRCRHGNTCLISIVTGCISWQIMLRLDLGSGMSRRTQIILAQTNFPNKKSNLVLRYRYTLAFRLAVSRSIQTVSKFWRALNAGLFLFFSRKCPHNRTPINFFSSRDSEIVKATI